MKILFPILNALLLAGILLTLFQIRVHMPPTFAEMKSADAEAKKVLLFRRPFFNSVEIDNTPLSVEIDGTPTVEIENTPLSVEIER